MEADTKVFDMQAKPFKWEVLPGEFVDAYGYAGTDGTASVPGPLIRVTEGDKVRIDITNNLPEATVIHVHGPRLPNAMGRNGRCDPEGHPARGNVQLCLYCQPVRHIHVPHPPELSRAGGKGPLRRLPGRSPRWTSR